MRLDDCSTKKVVVVTFSPSKNGSTRLLEDERVFGEYNPILGVRIPGTKP